MLVKYNVWMIYRTTAVMNNNKSNSNRWKDQITSQSEARCRNHFRCWDVQIPTTLKDSGEGHVVHEDSCCREHIDRLTTFRRGSPGDTHVLLNIHSIVLSSPPESSLWSTYNCINSFMCSYCSSAENLFFSRLQFAKIEIVRTHYNYWQIFFEYVKHCHLHENTQLLSVSFSLTHSRAAANCFVIYPKILTKYDEV